MRLNILIFAFIAFATYLATLYLDHRTPPNIATGAKNSVDILQSGQPAPDFTFTTPDGKTRKLSDFKGKIVVLNFWASWCPPCVKEFPVLLKILSAFPDDAVLIALSSDMDEAAMQAFLKKQPKITANVFIALDKNQAITQKLYQTFSLPETIIIAPDMTMRSKLIGANWEPKILLEKIAALRK